MTTPPTLDPDANPADVPDDVRNQVVDWFESTTNEERFAWANSARGSHPQLQLMMKLNTRQRDKNLRSAKEKSKREMTARERRRLIVEEGADAYARRPNTPDEEEDSEGYGGYSKKEVIAYAKEHGRHPAFDDDNKDERLQKVRDRVSEDTADSG
jgi:hypothetical protein